jgi:hypothetical protein
MIYFATGGGNTFDWASVIVPSAIALVIALLGVWAGLARYQQKVDDAKADIKKLQDDVHKMQMKLTEVSTKLEERTSSSESRVLKRKSPLSLNDYGEKILKASGGDAFVINHLDDLVEKIKKKAPKSAYDVQTYARDVIREVSNEERFVPIKDYAFKEGLDIDLFILVMGVFLRDLALPKLGCKPEDIDASDPTKKS